MELKDLLDYVEGLGSNLTKIEIKVAAQEGAYFVDETKETFVYEDESNANEKVDEVRQNRGFKGVDKKDKEAKYNKDGDMTKPESHTVVAKLLHY